VAKEDKNIWTRPAQPPAPMFMQQKGRNLVKQINEELEERVVGQQILYYAISRKYTNYHPVYGEALNKTFLNPVRVYCLVEWGGEVLTSNKHFGVDQLTKITINFHRRRLTEDQDLNVQVGDFALYGSDFYEIVTLGEPRELWGQQAHRFEIAATCIRAREGLFDVAVEQNI